VDVIALDGRGYGKFLAAGTYFLKKYRDVLNSLNVFPVPDGDTGTNMYLTARSATLEAAKLRDQPLSAVAERAAEGSLMGARGNSGVIVSQMLRGFAHHVRHRREIDTFGIATAMREAAAAARHALHERDLYRFVSGVLRAANEALDRTPEQLPALKEAGVVDAGGAGFVYFLEGILQFLPDVKVRATAFPRRPLRHTAFTPQQVVGNRKYCTEFVLENATIGAQELRALLEPRGESLLAIGDPPTIKVHLHTDDADLVQELAGKHGTLTRVKVDDMERQHRVLVVEQAQRPYSIAAVVPGDGFERIVKELGAEVVVSGAGNPSVRDLLLAVTKCMSDVVYLFVNDKNVALAGAEAAKLSPKRVHVIPTPDVVAGIAGLFAFAAGAGPPADEAIAAAAGRVRSAQVFFAGKDATIGTASVRGGKPAALAAGRLFAGESLAEVARAALLEAGAARGGLITLYYGGQQKERDAQRLGDDLRAAFPPCDVEYYYGGMKNAEYWLSLDE